MGRRPPAPEVRPARWTGLAARHPFVASIVAVAVTVGTTLAIGEFAGLHQVGRAFGHLRPVWLVAGVLTVVSLLAYVAAYRSVVAQAAGRRLTRRVGAGLVLSGFTAFTPAGGFEFDRRVLEQLGRLAGPSSAARRIGAPTP